MMKVFGIVSNDVAKQLKQEKDVPLLLSFDPNRKIGVVQVDENGGVTGEVEDEMFGALNGRGYGFDVQRDKEGHPLPETLSLIPR